VLVIHRGQVQPCQQLELRKWRCWYYTFTDESDDVRQLYGMSKLVTGYKSQLNNCYYVGGAAWRCWTISYISEVVQPHCLDWCYSKSSFEWAMSSGLRDSSNGI